MGKFAQAVEEHRQTTQKKCIVGRATEGFDDDDMNEFTTLLADRKFSTVQAVFGGRPGNSAIVKHAKGSCMCPEGVVGRGVIDG